METLKDVKEVLSKIPDEVLDRCFFGIGEGSEEIVSLIVLEEDDMSYTEVWEKYPGLLKISNLIQNVGKAQEILDNQKKSEELQDNLQQEGITDTYFDKKEE